MDDYEKNIKERYATLSEHELANIVRTADLTEIAQACLENELEKRGLNDLKSQIKELNRIDEVLVENSSRKTEERKKPILYMRKILMSFGFLIFFIGIVMYVSSESNNSIVTGSMGTTAEEKNAIQIMWLGGFISVIIWLVSFLRISVVKIFFRK